MSANHRGTKIGRRAALRIMSVASGAGAMLGIGAGTVWGQVDLRPTKPGKDVEKAFSRVRVEWGLKPADSPGVETAPLVGDELTEDQTSYAEVGDVLVARIRQPMKILDLRSYDRAELVRMKHAMLHAEARVRQAVEALARGDLGVVETRARVREAFTDYLSELESMPLK